MSNSPTELRQVLMNCIAKVRAGTMSGNDAKAVAMMASQINASLQVELNMRREGIVIPDAPMLPAPAAEEQPPEDSPQPPEGTQQEPSSPADLARAPWPFGTTRHTLGD